LFLPLLFLVVIPEGDLLLFLRLSLPLFVFAVILSAAKDPGTLRTAHTARTFPPSSPQPLPNAESAAIVGAVKYPTLILSDMSIALDCIERFPFRRL